ncbi:MAG: hypothetical protein K2X87_09210 [Gemmataceae bacterium]|nr:hypothetical protein [Gemmataceae bacterium]
MPRNLTAAWIAEAVAPSRRPVVFFEGVFSSGTLRLWNGYGDVVWGGNTWQGNGWFQGPEGMEETTELEATDMAVVLTGVSDAALALVLTSQRQGGLGTLWFGFLDAAGAVVADAYSAWSGYYSHAEVAYGPAEASVTLYYDSPLVDLERPNEGRWTDACQQRLFPGDTGFRYVVAAANWSGTWGQGKKKADRKRPPKGSRRRR